MEMLGLDIDGSDDDLNDDLNGIGTGIDTIDSVSVAVPIGWE